LLGAVELEDSLTEKDTTTKLTNIFTHNFDFGNNQKDQLAKTPNNRKPTLKNRNKLVSKPLTKETKPILKTHTNFY
jgi:hypothetical protein